MSSGRVFKWLDICGVQTGVLQYGQQNLNKLLFLVIPGNPGVIEYYDSFMKYLYDYSGQQIPVWGVSHAGHMSAHPKMKGQSDPKNGIYRLEGQIHHKARFIREYINTDTKIILIGHSIGCYMIMKLFNESDIYEQTVRAVHLFPTVERMAESPEGRKVTPFLRNFRWMAPYPLYLLWFLPEFIKMSLLRWWFKKRNVPECTYRATFHLFDPGCVQKSLNLANQEMHEVVELDSDLLKRTLSKHVFYYGADDHWCPIEYYHDMVKRFPTACVYLCKNRCQHAFVLEESQEMADWLWNWMKDNEQKVINV